MNAFLELLFPPQCGGCDALGSGFCARCRAQCVVQSAHANRLKVHGAGRYEGPLRRAIIALKDGRRDVAHALGALLAPLVDPRCLLVGVPTTAARARARAFDGGALLAQIAALQSGTCAVPLLHHHGKDAQRGRNREARLAARGRFSIREPVTADREILLVDDVMSTGATLLDCAQAITNAGGFVRGAIVLAVNAP